MVANPGGTFMYAVWNQWEEEITIDEFGNEHENLFNSDMPFRRHMYLPDDTTIEVAPVAEIMLAPTAALAADQLTFIGSGFDADDLDGAEQHRSLRLVLEHRWLHRLGPRSWRRLATN